MITMNHQQQQLQNQLRRRQRRSKPSQQSTTSIRQRLSYLWFGPTTTHFTHEVYLWIALVLLQISTFYNLYYCYNQDDDGEVYNGGAGTVARSPTSSMSTLGWKIVQPIYSFFQEWMTGTSIWNDGIRNSSNKNRTDNISNHGTNFDEKDVLVLLVVFLSTLWLGRFLWVRWVLTTGSTIKCTSKYPTMTGLITHWISSHIMSGQVLDRPANPLVVAKQIGIEFVGYGSGVSSNNSAFDIMGGVGGSAGITNPSGGSSGIFRSSNHDQTRQGGGGGGIWTMVSLRRFLPPSVAFTWQYMKIWIWYPFLSIKEKVMGTNNNQSRLSDNVNADRSPNRKHENHPSNIDGRQQQQQQHQKGGRRKNQHHHQQQKFGGSVGSSSGSLSTSPTSSSLLGSPPTRARKYLSYISSFLSKVWTQYGPSLQMLIPFVSLAFLVWYKLEEEDITQISSSRALYGIYGKRRQHALTLNAFTGSSSSDFHQESSDAIQPYGSYKQLEPPSWTRIVYYLCASSLACTIVLYGRVILPLPDLVVGTSVLKAIRNESKSHSSQGSSSLWSFLSVFNIFSFLGFRSRPSGKSSGRNSQRDIADTPWLERYKSIVDENRFRLVCKVILLRLVENLWICILFPRTELVCRFTRHCPSTVTTMSLDKILYHAGIYSPLRDDIETYDSDEAGSRDFGASILTTVSVMVITISILLAQAATLNRSYLGIMGYLTGEWVLVDENDPSLADGPRPSPWDPRRRYKKGDLICLESSSSSHAARVVYRAHSNSPEGKPTDFFLRAAHDSFRNELGHPASSHLIAFLSTVQFGLISISILMILLYELILERPTGSLLWTLTANLVAVYGGMIVGTPKYKEIARLADEISS